MKFLLIILTLLVLGCEEDKQVIYGEYSFLQTNGVISTMRQNADTLDILKCYYNKPCIPFPQERYKIISISNQDSFKILKIRSLDTFSYPAKKYPENNLSILILKIIDSNKVGIMDIKKRISQKEMDTTNIKSDRLDEYFYLTYYSENFLKNLKKLPNIKTKIEAEKLLEFYKSQKIIDMIKKYRSNNIYDMYGTALRSEILTSFCIQNSYNPYGAGRIINELMKN